MSYTVKINTALADGVVGGGGTGPDTSQVMEYISHHVIGNNPDDPAHGYSATRELAEWCFLTQFAELAKEAEGHFLFVQKAPTFVQKAPTFETESRFEGRTKWRVIGRFSIAKLKGGA